MNVQELRIGNLIHYSGSYLTEDNNEFNESLAAYLLLVRDEWDFVKPIPLTEEWLLKFGFKKPLDWHCFKLTLNNSDDERFKSSLQVGFAGCGYVQVCRSGINAYAVKCKYVHQLQNLYFALTGEELNVGSDEE
jgi:hypothetical protein